MDGILYSTYRSCLPSDRVQTLLAKYLVPKLEVLSSLNDLKILGCLDSGTGVSSELARRLKLPHYTLAIDVLRSDDENERVVGAISGIDDVVNFNPCPSWVPEQTTPSNVKVQKRALLEKAYASSDCRRWLEERHSFKKSTVVLVDSSVLCASKIKTGVESLHRAGIEKIILLGALLDKHALYGNHYPLQSGIFLRRFEAISPLQECVQKLESHDEASSIESLLTDS